MGLYRLKTHCGTVIEIIIINQRLFYEKDDFNSYRSDNFYSMQK